MRKPTIEWAAGLFEGEGCMYKGHQSKAPHNPYYQLTVEMCDGDVVRAFANFFGVGHIYEKDSRKDNWSPTTAWRTSKASEVRKIISAMLPYFGNRRAHKALDILDDLELAT
jgi:hypothetical protein